MYFPVWLFSKVIASPPLVGDVYSVHWGTRKSSTGSLALIPENFWGNPVEIPDSHTHLKLAYEKKHKWSKVFQMQVLICGASELWAFSSKHCPSCAKAQSMVLTLTSSVLLLSTASASGFRDPRTKNDFWKVQWRVQSLFCEDKQGLLNFCAIMGKTHQLIWQSQLLFNNSLEIGDCGTPPVLTSKVDLCRSWQTSLTTNLYLCSWRYNSKVVAK